MQQDTPKDTTAWTARFSTVDFECELPPGVRAELLRPRRAKMLGRPPSPPQKPPQVDSARSWRHLSPWLQSILTLVGMIFVPIFLVTVVWAILAVLSPRPAAPTKPAAPVAQPAPAVLPVPRALRATLVRLPAPRAELISIPVGGSFFITLPYGQKVWATYTGHVPSFEALPSVGRYLGETRVAADTNIPWVWTTPPGGVAQWVDP
jgi:hypothetical protein